LGKHGGVTAGFADFVAADHVDRVAGGGQAHRGDGEVVEVTTGSTRDAGVADGDVAGFRATGGRLTGCEVDVDSFPVAAVDVGEVDDGVEGPLLEGSAAAFGLHACQAVFLVGERQGAGDSRVGGLLGGGLLLAAGVVL